MPTPRERAGCNSPELPCIWGRSELREARGEKRVASCETRDLSGEWRVGRLPDSTVGLVVRIVIESASDFPRRIADPNSDGAKRESRVEQRDR